MTPQESFEGDYYRRLGSARPWRMLGEQPIAYRTWTRELSRHAATRAVLIDVGCGLGHFLRYAQRRFGTVVGVDISAAGLIEAAERVGFRVARSSAVALPFGDATADVVTGIDLVEHLNNPDLFFREAHRVLRPAGVLFISTPNTQSFGARLKGRLWFGYRDATHVSLLPPPAWRKRIGAAGFDIIRDGTDALWDVPYWQRATRLQWLVLIGARQLLSVFRSSLPWSLGENYICTARRR